MSEGLAVLRIEQAEFQTPIREFYNPYTGSTIHAVGMTHIAEQDYFDTIAEFALDQENRGAAVHYEGVRPVTPEQRAADPRGTKEAEHFGKHLSAIHRATARHSGLVFQKDAMQPPETWENPDIDLVTLVKSLGSTVAQTLLQQSPKKRIANTLPCRQKSARAEFNAQMRNLAETDIVAVLGDTGKTLLEARNSVQRSAIETELLQIPDRDFVVLWGAAHLIGMSTDAHNLGYKQSGVRWLNAFSVE